MPNTNPVSRTHIINKLISDNNLDSYLEIGVSNPYTNFLSISANRKTSVDPCVECEYFSKDAIELFKPFITHQMTSDEFFKQNSDCFDIVFIDGDHSFNQSLTDLNNAIKVIPVGGFIVLHDAMPNEFEATQITNFEQKLVYNGNVWKTVLSAIANSGDYLKIGTFPYDFGVTVIKKLSSYVPEIPALDLNYHQDFNIPALLPIYDLDGFRNKKVSYFTPLYNIPHKLIKRTARCVLNQTAPNWEWVLYDDSDNDADAKRLAEFFLSLNDSRIKYFRFNQNSGGFIGWAKKRAADLCTGDYLAELDHDDLIMPQLTEQILKYGNGFDFIYSNYASVIVNDDDSLDVGEIFDAGFSMGYGSYRTTADLNPLTGVLHSYQECIACPINPKTIRHIVGIPNHVRVWDRKFYNTIGGHNVNMWVADDYELVIRSFISGGKFLHLDTLGYLQVLTGKNTTDKRLNDIQTLVKSVLYTYDTKIKDEFELRNIDDWAHKWHANKFGFCTDYHYWDVPTIINTISANLTIMPAADIS